MDWSFIFKTFNEFKCELAHNKNVNFLSFDKAEGDDIIAYIVKENNSRNVSNVIISNDSDLHQLLKYDTHNGYINMMYNYKYSDERSYWPNNFNIFLHYLDSNSADIFDMNNNEEFTFYLSSLISKTKVKEVIPEKSLFVKIVSGDKKDNILSSYKAPLGRGIGEEGASKIYDMYLQAYQTIDFDSDEFVTNVTNVISFYKKIKEESELSKIRNSIRFNIRMLRLENQYLPQNLLEKMKNSINVDELKIYVNDDIILEKSTDKEVEKMKVEKMEVQKMGIDKKSKVNIIEIENKKSDDDDFIDNFFEI